MLAISRLLVAVAALAGIALSAVPAGAYGWVWPVQGEVLTAYRNGGDPYAAGQHRGIDIAAADGSPVVAAAGGSVRFAGVAGSSGLTISIRTADGLFDVSYLHLSAIGVRKGDEVAAGERIGAVGSTGTRSTTASHLHFGIREGGSRHAYRDPLELLPPPAPVSEAPRGAPAPVGAPVRVAPDPLPVRGRGRAPSPAPRRVRPVPVPDVRRIPVALHRPGAPVGSPAPSPSPVVAPSPVSVGRPGRLGERAPVGRPEPGRPGLGQAPPPLPVSVMPEAAPAARFEPSTKAPENRGGLDLGWALGCAGLLAALALLHRRSPPRHEESAGGRSFARRRPPVLDGR